MQPRKNAIAICGKGALGLITSEKREVLRFSDGERACWTGIHLTDKVRKSGSYWCSSNPTVVGYLDELLPMIDLKDF